MPAQRILPIYLAVIALLVAGLWKLYPLRQMPAADAAPAAEEISPKMRAFRTPFEAAFAGEQGFRLWKAINLGDMIAVVGQRQTGEAHADAGDDSVRYVKRDGRMFRPVKNARVDTSIGSWGDPGGFHIRKDLSQYPMLVLDGGGTWQGCTAVWTTLIELPPEKPLILFSKLLTGISDSETKNGDDRDDDNEDWTMSSSLRLIGRSIVVHYVGDNRKTIKLSRQGDKLIQAGNLPWSCMSPDGDRN